MLKNNKRHIIPESKINILYEFGILVIYVNEGGVKRKEHNIWSPNKSALKSKSYICVC